MRGKNTELPPHRFPPGFDSQFDYLTVFHVERMQKKYVGERDRKGDPFVAVINLESKSARPLPLGLEHVRHSPTGFSWGYLGSGPAQLAFAILLDHFGGSPLSPLLHYQEFKQRVIANLPLDHPWQLTTAEIENTLAMIRTRREAACPDTT